MTPTRTSSLRIIGSQTCTGPISSPRRCRFTGSSTICSIGKFATFGTYFDPRSIVNVLPNPPTDPRTITPAQPLSIYVGMRAKLVIEPYLPTAGETSTPRVPWRREASALREGPVTNSGWWDAASAFANRGHTVAYVRGKYAVGRQPYHRGFRVPTKYPESKAHWNWVWKPNPLLGRLVGSLYSVLR